MTATRQNPMVAILHVVSSCPNLFSPPHTLEITRGACGIASTELEASLRLTNQHVQMVFHAPGPSATVYLLFYPTESKTLWYSFGELYEVLTGEQCSTIMSGLDGNSIRYLNDNLADILQAFEPGNVFTTLGKLAAIRKRNSVRTE